MLALLSMALHGCRSIYSVVEFEVLEPATVQFPDQVNQLLFLNRAPLTPLIWAENNQTGMDARQLVLLDTLIMNNLHRGILEVLRSSPIESFHMPIWLSDRRMDTSLLEERILTKREVADMCDTMGGDAVISLEFYSAALDQHFDYYKESPGEVQNHYYEVSNRLIWNIYLPDNPRPFDRYTLTDTLFFPAISDGEFLPYSPGVDMIRELFYGSGIKYGSYLVPIWNRTTRLLYGGKEDSLKLAVKYTGKGDWEQAYSIWNRLSESGDSTLGSKAYYNMAIYYEIEDNLDSASMMLDMALERDTLARVRMYREELDVRLLNRNDILKQVN
ncbi:MAG: DUF6340 family protein [Bacteroidales bacterium]|nr:DUF6340 family protein [Bacteroidales bacterium]